MNVAQRGQIADKILLANRLILLLGIFLIPWFTLKSTTDYSEFPKTLLLVGGLGVVLVLWMTRAILKGRLEIKNDFLDTPEVLLAVFYGASVLFSPDRFASVFGDTASTRLPWVVWVAGTVLYLFIKQLFRERRNLVWFMAAFGAGAIIALIRLIVVVTPFAHWPNFMVGPNLMTRMVLDSAFLLPALTFFGAALWSAFGGNKIHKALGLTLFVLAVGAQILVGLQSVKIVTLLGLLGAAGVAYFFKVTDGIKMAVIFLLSALVLGLSFIIPVQALFRVVIPTETSLSLKVTTAITQSVLGQNTTRLLFGEGPNTFRFAFSRFRPATLNYTSFWQERFGASGSAALEFVQSSGLLGALSMLVLVFALIFITYKTVSHRLKNINLSTTDTLLTYFSGAAVLAASWALVFSGGGLVTWVLWLVSICVYTILYRFSKNQDQETVELFSTRARGALVVVGFLVTLGILILVAVTYGRLMSADKLLTASQNKDFTTKSFTLMRAIELNPERADLYNALAAAELQQSQTGDDMAQPEATSYRMLLAAMQVSERATTVLPNNINAWEQLAAVYLQLAAATPEATHLLSGVADRAIMLEPTNPVWLILKGDTLLSENNPDKALLAYSLAGELKKDWTVPYVKQAAILGAQKKIDEAIDVLQKGLEFGVNDPDYLFVLGTLYFNRGKAGDMEKAETIYQASINILPGNKQTLLALGLTEERLGKPNEALVIFQRLLALNPSDPNVLKHIRTVRSQVAAIKKR